jgi:hypothetical protein
MAAQHGAWVGLGAGRTWDGSFWRNVVASEAGAWVNSNGLSLVGTIAPMRLDDTIRYTDTELSSRWTSAKLELGASIGVRGGAHVPAIGGTGNGWGSLAIVAWLVPQIGLVFNAGTYPVDLTQGFPGGRFATLSVRLRTHPPRDRELAVSEDRSRTKGVVSFSAQPGASAVTVRVRAPGAHAVEVMGDFTAWQPVAMRPAGDGSWYLTLPAGSGAHQLNLRVDGGTWAVPPGLPVVTDEFGGSFGLLVLP